MKIGMLSIYPPEKDGIAIYTDNLVKELRNQGVEVVTIGTKNSDCDYRLDLKSIFLFSYLDKIIKKEKIELLHTQYIASRFSKYLLNLNLILALKNIRIPKITTTHEVQYNCRGFRNHLLCWIEKQVVKNSSLVITHTPGQADFLHKKYGSNAKCVYMGINQKINKPKKNKKLLFFGIISRGKGLEYLIKAMDNLKDFELTIVGRCDDETYKEEIISLASGKTNIHLNIGWADEKTKDRCYRESSIVVLPYVWAPYQSAVLHDAFAYGLPVVVTKTGAVWEIVEAFKTGVVVEPKNSRALAEGIIKTSIAYNSFIKGVAIYAQEADWRQVGKKTSALYQESDKK